jgi:hypothetical protein
MQTILTLPALKSVFTIFQKQEKSKVKWANNATNSVNQSQLSNYELLVYTRNNHILISYEATTFTTSETYSGF